MSTKKYRLYNYLILLNHKDSIVTFFYRTISYSIYHNIRCPPGMKKPALRASVVGFTSIVHRDQRICISTLPNNLELPIQRHRLCKEQ
ncbi:hypothetical protein DL735_26180 [Escherichia coli]|nr:hypothetical protein [Escherichia coli]